MDINIAYVRFKLPARRHFELYDVIWLPLLLRIDVLLYATIGQPCDVIDIQNGGAREI